MHFCKIENFTYGWINERSFSNPHPWKVKYHYAWLMPECAPGRLPARIRTRSISITIWLNSQGYWEVLSLLFSVGTIRNTVIKPGWSRAGLAVLIHMRRSQVVGFQSSAVAILNVAFYSYRLATHTFHRCSRWYCHTIPQLCNISQYTI